MVAIKSLAEAEPIVKMNERLDGIDGLKIEDRLKVLEKYGIYKTLADLKKAKIGDLPYILLSSAGRIDYVYSLGNYSGQTDEVNVIALDTVPPSVGALVKQSSSSLTFRQPGKGSVIRDHQTKSQEFKSVLDFGAIADNTVHKVSEWIIPGARGRFASLANLQAEYPHVTSVDDYIDWAAIQATINWLEENNGGTAYLPKVNGRYIINRGLKLKSCVQLCGSYKAHFLYNAGNPKSSALVADFSDPLQWVIDTDSRQSSRPLGLKEFYSAALPDGAVYDCGVRNLIITSVGNLPYGGIRIAGAPGSHISGVGVHRVGCGILVNMSFGCRIEAFCLTAYYGFVGWNDYNGNNADIYCARADGFADTVPANYMLQPFVDLAGQLTNSTYGMASNDHLVEDTGVVIGGTGSTSNNNTLSVVVERFSVQEFFLNTYSLGHTKSYFEASTLKTLIAASNCTFTHQTFHCFASGTGQMFDLGKGVSADINLNGSAFVAGFGSVALTTETKLMLRTVTLNQFGPTYPQFNIIYEQVGAFFPLTLQNGVTALPDSLGLGFRKEGVNTVFQGAVVVPADKVGQVMFNVGRGFRPYLRAFFGKWAVLPNGDAISYEAGVISLQGSLYESIS